MKRSGFTLVELLVSVTVIAALAAITLTALDVATAPSPAEESRSLASFIKGAKYRAIYNKERFGVRLNLDPLGPTNAAGNPIVATSATYIEDVTDTITATVAIADDPATPALDYRRIIFTSTGQDRQPGIAGEDDDTDGWYDNIEELGNGDDQDTGGALQQLFDQNLLDPRGVTVHLSLNARKMRAVMKYDGSNWVLTKDWPGTSLNKRLDIKLELSESRLVAAFAQEDRAFSRGVCIDLETSRVAGRIPDDWYDDTTNKYSEYLDIVFNPDGTCQTNVQGVMSLQLITAFTADVETTARNSVLYDMSTRPNREFERLVYIGMRSGRVGTAELNFEDTNSNDVPDDPFLFAETDR